ncbi:MAG: DNA polymerase [Deltaproteobacteria bacterium]
MSEVDVIKDPAEVARFLETIGSAPFIALDTETSGLDPHNDNLLLIQFGTATEQALVAANAVEAHHLAPIFRPDRIVVMHNATFDLKMLWNYYGDALGLQHARIADTQSTEKLLRNGRKSDVVMQGFALKTLAERYAGMELDKSIRQGFYGLSSVDELSEAELYYAARDVEATWKVFAEQLPQIERDKLVRVAALEGAASIGFAQMELRGIAIDTEAWSKQLDGARTGSAAARKELDREFWEVADRDLFGGTTLNYDSDDEVLSALEKLGVKLTTTRREVLVATGHPAAMKLAEYREQQKTVSTYGDAFLAHVHSKTGRLHPRFRSVGASTGRASCAEPNLQNIPSGSEFRACFAAPEGRKIITADYSGAELRIIAELSKDPVFRDTFLRGEDLHATVASRLFRKPVSKTENPDLRARAKAINFGLAYGMGAAGLARQLDVNVQEGERLLDAYFRSFPKIRGYLESSAREAIRRGYAETMSGRRFWLLDMRRDGREEHTVVRVAKNMPVQGTNADIIKLAMARVVPAFKEAGVDAFLVNMVHDELVVEAAEGDAEAARDILVREMKSAGAEFVKRVPMEIDATISEAWSK